MSSKTFISDLLHTLIGFSDSTLTSFLHSTATAKKSTPAKLLQTLEDYEVEPVANSGLTLNGFCEQVWRECNKSAGGAAKKMTNADMLSKANKYVGERANENKGAKRQLLF